MLFYELFYVTGALVRDYLCYIVDLLVSMVFIVFRRQGGGWGTCYGR